MLDRSMRLIFHRPDDPVPKPFRHSTSNNSQCGLTDTESINSDDMDTNSRKRKMESEDSNDGDVVSIKSETKRSVCDLEEDKLTYGLKYNYLNSLGIKPPLEQWVHVSNFRCDKSELKEVLELAGHVIICSMITIRGRYAKVMYSHPLEAVQAVSMLNGQVFYGQKLKVTMIPCPGDTILLPKGLANVGPGLGAQGRPLRSIVKEYNKFVKNLNTQVDVSLFRNADDKDDEFESEIITINDEGRSNATKHVSRPFKVKNVEDLPDDESVSSESKSKKAKRDSEYDSEASDQESEYGKYEKKSNVSDDEPRPIDIVVPRRDPRFSNGSTSNYSPNQNQGTDMLRPPMPVSAMRPQNRPMMYASGPPQMGPPGPRMGPSGPRMGPPGPRMGPCPPPPMIGPISQPGTMSPFAQTARPLGPPNRPMGEPPRQMGPPSRTVHSGSVLMPAAAHTGPPGLEPARHTAPFPQVANSPFRPSVPNMANILPNPTLGPHSVVRGNAPVPEAGQTITLELRNLPPSTTFQLLCDKVSQCGQLFSLQLTTPGCAIAKFPHRAHADRCFQFFHGKFIDGCVIEVRFV